MNNVAENEMVKELFAKIDFLCYITRISLYNVEWYAELEKESLSKENRFSTNLGFYSLSQIAKLFEVSIDDLLNEPIYNFTRKVRIAILKKEIKEMEDELERELEEKRKLYMAKYGKDYVAPYVT